jgi:hypothetical protein
MQLRENARPMTDEEFEAWMKRQEDINWAMRGDGRPDSSPGLVAWVAGAVLLVVIVGALVLS